MYIDTDKTSHLLSHYDPMNRNEIRIAEFLVDIKDLVLNH